MAHKVYTTGCSIDGCNEDYCARGLCKRHYAIARRLNALPSSETYKLRREQVFRSSLKFDPMTGCLEWIGPKFPKGYANIGSAYGFFLGHRYAWFLEYGPIPDGMLVCHTCDNPPCCEPTHLFLGTNVENMADMVSKDRQCKGSKIANSKLVEADVIRIKRELSIGLITNAALGEMFGVSRCAINDIEHGRTWKHI